MKVLEWGEDGMTTPDESDALQTSFRQEVAVWHKLDHPNVTKVKMDFFVVEDIPYRVIVQIALVSLFIA